MEPDVLVDIYVYGILTKPIPALTLLKIGIDLFLPTHKSVVFHILLAAHLMILRNLAPNLSDLERMVDHNYTFKLILVMNAMKLEAFSKSWSIWTARARPVTKCILCISLEMCAYLLL